MAEKVDIIVKSTDAQASVPCSAAEALKKHEAAKMSRRAVLSKVGLQFGAAALLALSVDDLARKVTATIAARDKDNQVAQAVANEFKNAGIAFAEDDFNSSNVCYLCVAAKAAGLGACTAGLAACMIINGNDQEALTICKPGYLDCETAVRTEYSACCYENSCNCGL